MAVPFVDPDVCTGCELCTQIAADTFAMNDDGVAEISNPTGNDNDTIQEAIDSCPVTAIAWKE
jgi:ferredoxin